MSSAEMLEGSLRRARSAGDMRMPRNPEIAYLPSQMRISRNTGNDPLHRGPRSLSPNQPPTSWSGRHQESSSASIHHQGTSGGIPSSAIPIAAPQSVPHRPQASNRPTQPDTRPPPPRLDPFFIRFLSVLGVGRGASRERKLVVSLTWKLFWEFCQFVVIITMLVLSSTHFKSTVDSSISEWIACDRPLGTWGSLWVVRIVLASTLSYWDYVRDRARAPTPSSDTENVGNASNSSNTGHVHNTTVDSSGNQIDSRDRPSTETERLPYTRLYSRLTLLSSLLTLSWFLTAHILEYTSVNTCRHTSPHLWWLIFGILCIMYLMVLEVVILGLIVLVIAPILFVFWNIIIICLGRHPLQNPGMIKPEVAKLPKSVVDRIPLVIYIPSPPDTESAGGPNLPHLYPPKKTGAGTKPIRSKRFRFLKKFSSRSLRGDPPQISENTNIDEKGSKGADVSSEAWEENWEQGEYPFVALEGHRAACSICLMDFEEPKKKESAIIKRKSIVQTQVKTMDGGHEEDVTDSELITAPITVEEEARMEELRLADPGEGAQPLRLLPCGHVFHQSCVDPWLLDVSGRCPICQRAVILPKKA